MKRRTLTSIIFNLLFWLITLVLCIAYIPLLILPRSWFIGAVKLWVRIVALLERVMLGLRYEVRGLEHLPQNGPFIIAAKHQSAYETFKLHLLFNDPAIILKRELLRIPLWGAYLWKSDVIAIDRTSPKTAQQSLHQGALRMKDQGRPIVIFPQGTRVAPDATTQDKPYKSGIASIQKVTALPIIPLALNTGLFWPRGGFLKSGGTVIFEFLPPIAPGKNKKELMAMIEKNIENTSAKLMSEAQLAKSDDALKDRKKSSPKAAKTEKAPKTEKAEITSLPFFFKIPFLIFLLLILLGAAYSYSWQQVAEGSKRSYYNMLYRMTKNDTRPETMRISGFPGPVQLDVPEEIITTNLGTMRIKNLRARFLPIPASPLKLSSDMITLESDEWASPVVLDSFNATLYVDDNIVTITDSALKQSTFTAAITGRIDTAQEPIPALDLKVALENHDALLSRLANSGLLKQRVALFMGAGFSSLADPDGIVRVPFYQRGQWLYVGPIAVYEIPVQPIN